MTYKIEFEDQHQDLLRIQCDEKTGEITSAAPFHHDMYANGKHFVDVSQLMEDRIVHFTREGEKKPRSFKWPMIKLSLNDKVLAEAA